MANVPGMVKRSPFVDSPALLAGDGGHVAGTGGAAQAPVNLPTASSTAAKPSLIPRRTVRFSDVVTTIDAEPDRSGEYSDDSLDDSHAPSSQTRGFRPSSLASHVTQPRTSNASLASSADTLNSSGQSAAKSSRSPKGAKAAAAITAAALAAASGMAVVAEPVMGGKGVLIRQGNAEHGPDVDAYQSDDSDREQAKGGRKSQAVRKLTKAFRKAFGAGAGAAAGAPRSGNGTPPAVTGERTKPNGAAVHVT